MGLTRPRAHQILDIDYKQAVRVAAVSNVTLSGGAPATVDDVSLSANDRVLVTGQSTASQNGIYYVQTLGNGSNGTWVRGLDANATGELFAGMIVMVTEGTAYSDKLWSLTTNGAITIGTTSLTFALTGGTGNAITSGTSHIKIAVEDGNANVNIAGTSNVVVFASTGVIVTGITTVSGNITGGNVITAGLASATGNITGGNLNTGAQVVATGNITGGNLITAGLASVTGTITATANVTGGNLVTSGAVVAATANIGNLQMSNTTITTVLANGNITLTATGTAFAQVAGTYGFVIPSGNTAQRLSSGNVTGTMRFNTDNVSVEVYDGNEWDRLVGGVTNQAFAGDGSTTTFALDKTTTTAALLVMLNGVVQIPTTGYAVNPSPGTSLVFTEAPADGDTIDTRYL